MWAYRKGKVRRAEPRASEWEAPDRGARVVEKPIPWPETRVAVGFPFCCAEWRTEVFETCRSILGSNLARFPPYATARRLLRCSSSSEPTILR